MFQHGSACYELASTVNQLTASAELGRVVLIGGQSFVVSVAGFTDTTITYEYLPAGGGASVLQLVPSSPPVCGLLTAADALQMGWAIGAVWLAVYAVTMITSYIKSEVDGIKNDT